MAPVRHLSILGSTGSIGQSALKVVEHLRGRVKVAGLAAGSNARELLAQALKFKPKVVALSDPQAGAWLKARLANSRGYRPRVVAGPQGLGAVAREKSADLVLTSVVGAAGLLPTLEAIRAGKDIALANKETLVAAGELVSREAARHRVLLLPVDSEHNAIFQCLACLPRRGEVKRLILTASGGPFRTLSRRDLAKVTLKQALNHPTWNMGPKITVDSATLMNKGLEVLEAHWLFGLPLDRIGVLVHPQSVIHSMVETVDGSVLAQLGPTDMRLPIQYALTYPRRLAHGMKALDFLKLKALTFEAPDFSRFPCLALAYEAGRTGGTAPAALNAANETAVAMFLTGRLGFLDIPRMIKKALHAHRNIIKPGLEEILAADQWARKFVNRLVEEAG